MTRMAGGLTRPRRQRRGSLFWDLLAAVAVLGLAVAFVAPIFLQKGREIHCHRRSCKSNLRQIGVAIAMYAQDHDEHLPSLGPAPGVTSATLPVLVHPYIRNPAVWSCTPETNVGGHSETFDGTWTDTSVSYGYNGKCLSPHGVGVPMTGIVSRKETLALVDSSSHLAVPRPLAPTLGGGVPFYRHVRKAGTLWLDGHVTNEPPGRLEATATQERGNPLGSGINQYLYWNRD